MSKGYWIVRVSVRDQDRYPEYLAAAQPAFAKYGAKFIVRGGTYETMEGNARERNVVVEFKDHTTALACYRSPEYQAAKSLRQRYAETDFIVIRGCGAYLKPTATCAGCNDLRRTFVASTLEGFGLRSPDVRFGSEADMCVAKRHVRFSSSFRRPSEQSLQYQSNGAKPSQKTKVSCRPPHHSET